jgi:hypothetical protein
MRRRTRLLEDVTVADAGRDGLALLDRELLALADADVLALGVVVKLPDALTDTLAEAEIEAEGLAVLVIEPVMLADELRDEDAVAVELMLAVPEAVGLCTGGEAAAARKWEERMRQHDDTAADQPSSRVLHPVPATLV